GVQVSAEQMDRARMEIATKGMPQTGRMGFELFDKPNWVGSEFDEKVIAQRAYESNSKVVHVADDMYSQINNMVR
ncbi:MAG TPA: flagellar basal body rod C-terminal domain-containing protein, partial [Terriglobales bacterium]|nr:flagellar basal body rod C-terminal domain-containing protein [Terriglobales bacterium]